MNALLGWLQTLALPTAIRQTSWLFPAVETLHVFALAMVVGSVALMDLRLLGLWFRDRRVSEMASMLLPWSRGAFVLAALSGLALFSSAAVHYWSLSVFRAKLALLVLAGINMAAFHLLSRRSIHAWDRAAMPPGPARAAGLLSLLLWVGVVLCGRWLGFLDQPGPG